MTTRIMISQCLAPNGRESKLTEEEIEALAVSIRDTGMKHPVLATLNRLDGTYSIVDGLSRILAASKLGLVTIEAVVAEDLGQACKLLEKVNAKRTLNVRRQWEISDDLLPLMLERRTYNLRARNGRMPSEERGLQSVARAIGLKSEHVLKIIRECYKVGPGLGDEGLELLRRMENEELTYNQVRSRLYNLAFRLALPPVSPVGGKQQALLLAVGRSLGTAIKAGFDAALPVGISQEDLNVVLKDLRKARANLARLIHTLEKEVTDD